jgi:hypothetical protein
LGVVPRYRGRPSLATIPLRLWTFVQHRRGSVSGRGSGPCGFSPCVNRARHAPQDPRFTPVRTSHSPRSLFTRGVPLPVREPCTTGPDLLRFQSGNAPGIPAPFAVFPARGSRRLKAHPVTVEALFPPFIPTCRLLIVRRRCFLRLLAAVSELLPCAQA